MTKNKVLIVDDEPMVQKIVKRIVEDQGAEALIADSADKVNNIMVNADNIKLAVLDLLLPNSSGWDIMDIIEKHSRIPIIIMTGVALSSDEKKKLLTRAKAIVEKNDFDINNFSKLLITILSQ